MNKNYVVDANVIAKLVLNEHDSLQAENFVSEALKKGGYFFVPALFSYELVGLLKKNNTPNHIIETFMANNHDKRHMKIVSLDSALLRKALEISETGNKKSGFPTFYDCVYHALAMLNDCDFVTADRRHYKKTKVLGNIRLLEDMEAISE